MSCRWVFSPFGFGSLTEALARVARWPVLLLVLLVGLAVLYRYGPDRRAARWQWVTVGSVSAAVTWIVASFLGSLGAAVGVMVWLWISTTVMLLGAELNAEIEHQTARDSTVGSEQPLGSRGRGHGRHCGSKADLVSDFVVWVRAV